MKAPCLHILLIILMLPITPIRLCGQQTSIDTLAFALYNRQFQHYKINHADSAAYYIHKMDSVTKPRELSISRYKYYDILGGWYKMQEKLRESLNAYNKCFEIAVHFGIEKDIVKARFNIASQLSESGNLKEGIKEFKALEEFIALTGNDYDIRTSIYGNMALLSLNLNDTAQAVHYNRLMKKHLKTYDDSVRYYLSSLHLLDKQEKYRQKIGIGQKALKSLRENDLLHKIIFYTDMGSSYLKLKELDPARHYLSLAKNMADKFGMEQTNVELALGDLAYASGDFNTAFRYFSKVKKTCEKSGSQRLLTEVLPRLRDTYLKLGFFREAFEMQEKDIALRDSVTGLNSMKYVAELEAKYKLREKDQTIKQQKRVNDLQKELLTLENSRKKVLALLLFISLSFLALNIYLTQKLIKVKNKTIKNKARIELYAKRLEETNTMRDKLFVMISHDLKSPIANLINTLALYDDKSFSKIAQSLGAIQLTLNNLLKWAEMQLKEAQPHIEELALDRIINSVIKQTAGQANQKNISLMRSFEHQSNVFADEQYLQIVLRNVLMNAIKYTPNQGFIKLNTLEDKGYVTVSVRDSGIGIPKEKLETLFAYPQSSKGTNGERGTGLGLTLCKELIQKVNGKIEIKSKEWVGTEVILKIPAQ